MKKRFSVLAMASILVAGSAMASGWRIPEQSVDSTAKSGANIASASHADTAYYNPANMGWLSDTWNVEIDATWIHLTEIEYTDNRSSFYDGKSETEDFFLPTGFFVSPNMGGARIGLSITAPGGLAKRWESAYQKALAKEFSLAVIEVNPVVSYTLFDKVSVAAGPRMVYADATVTSDASGIGKSLSRDMSGDTVEWGWNVAVAYKPIETLNISATYRSNVDLDFEDKADVNLLGYQTTLDAEVSVPLPAVLAFSVSYDILENLNVDFTYDRTFWSEYEAIDFDFSPAIPGNPFEPAVTKDWEDTNAYRLGITYGVTKTIDIMAGIAYDENPAPDSTVSFELPDSDAWLFSLGMQYKLNENMDIGCAALYDYKEDREVTNSSVDGEFTGAGAILVTVGMNYRF